MAPSSPIRVAIIGLGRGSGDLVPGIWASQVHLPYLLASPHFSVTAICNSTVASAEASIAHHNLGPDVKAYGDPSDLAEDSNVDLAVVSVRVASHYDLTKPLLLGGKDVFVEWPLAATLDQAEELTAIAKEKGVRTIVGLQGRASPLVTTLRNIISSNKIGQVTSTVITGYFSLIPVDKWIAGAEYYLDIDSGGNSLTIHVGHILDSVTKVLGPFSTSPGSGFAATLATMFPTVSVIDPATGTVVDPSYPKTSPDHVFVQGKLESGAPASFTYRTIPAGGVEDDVGLKWIITGTEGEVVVTVGKSQFAMLADNEIDVKIRKGAKGAVETVDITEGIKEDSEAVKGASDKARNTARVWEAWINGEEGKAANFEDAVQNHKLIASIRSAAGK